MHKTAESDESDKMQTRHVTSENTISPIRRAKKTKSARSWVAILAIAMMVVLASSSTFLTTHNHTQAQQLQPPQLHLVTFDGLVTVNGSFSPDVEGLSLSAKVGEWVSESVTIGQGTDAPNGYKDLNVRPPQDQGLIGAEITFILGGPGGTVESTTTSHYAKSGEDGSSTRQEITFPEFRKLNIDFPSLPEPISPSPSPQPATGEPTLTVFSGQALTPDGPVPNGYQLFAVIGETKRTNNATVIDGEYSLAIETTDTSHDGSTIRFFLIDRGDVTNPNNAIEAETPSTFTAGQSAEVRLVFSMLAPTATPTFTPTPIPPTATPVPPTATPVPPTATPIPPTATPVPPTATPVPPTATPVPPTATPIPPTATPVPPTATPIPPTATPVPPTATPIPPTATPVPPTATPVPPTATPVPPTATPVPPTAVPPTPTPEPEESGGLNTTLILAIILVLVILGVAGYFGWQYSRRSRTSSNES